MSKKGKKRKQNDNRIVPAAVYADRMNTEKGRLEKLIVEREARLRREAAQQAVPRITYYPDTHPTTAPTPYVPRPPRNDRRLYFAYGSNLSWSQMKHRCPGAVKLYPHDLPGFKLEFQRFANIVEGTEEDSVPGAIYLVPPEDEAMLDRYEGVNSGSYVKKTFKFFTPKNNWRDVLYYQKKPGRPTPPAPHYLQVCLNGYRQWGLNERKLEKAIEEAKEADAQFNQQVEKNLKEMVLIDNDWRDWILRTQIGDMPLSELKQLADNPNYGWGENHLIAISNEINRREPSEE